MTAEKISILHIGKTGGTAVKGALKRHRKRHGDDVPFEMFKHWMTLPKLIDRQPSARAVFFVRDPVARYLSGFNSRLRQGRPRHDSPWKPEEEVSFKRFPTANKLAEALSDADPAVAAEAREAMNSIKHVKAPLVHFLVSTEFLQEHSERIFFIGSQETLNQDFPVLRDRLGVDADIEIDDDPVSAHRSPSSDDKYLSELAVANLKQWYAADYPILDWCLDWRARKAGMASKPEPAGRSLQAERP